MDMVIISLLGSTGSIGRQTLDVVRELGKNATPVKITALAAGSNVEALAEQAREFRPKLVAIYDKNAAPQLRQRLAEMGLNDIEIAVGMDGLLQCATDSNVQIVVSALVGSIGLRPTLAAIEAGKDIAIANKETLVAGGALVMPAAKKKGVRVLPIDSEHSAIWQCLRGNERNAISRLILTASGGAFREWTREAIATAKATDALQHPTWNMGAKITIDCATMMNKGLECIEAHWLFGTPCENIEVWIHPQSVVHSMVEFADGAMMAQCGAPDMRLPIQYALAAPARFPPAYSRLDFFSELTFAKPDFSRFPCLTLAFKAAEIGGTLPVVMNAVNELAVADFLHNAIGFYDISRLIEEAFAAYTVKPVASLTDVEEAEVWSKDFYSRRK